MDRRRFLNLFSLLPFSGLLSSCAWASTFERKRKIIVVGAGMAGLSAADQLLRAGYDVRLLEAAPRAGGKVRGGLVGDRAYDVGGQGFSARMHRVRALGRRFGLTEIALPEQVPFFARGTRVMTGDAVEKILAERESLYERATHLYPDLANPLRRAELQRTSVAEWARRQGLSEDAALSFRSFFEADWCEAPERVSMLHFLEASRADEGDTGDMDFRFREGLFRLAEGLSAQLRPVLMLGTPVRAIEMNARGVRVTAVTGATGAAAMTEAIFEADAAVLAIPLPVLKRLPMTGPGLDPLREALEPFEGAAVRKVLITYAKPFWKDHATQGEFSDPSGLSTLDNSDEAAGAYSIAAFVGGTATRAPLGRAEILSRLARVLGPEALSPLAYIDTPWTGAEFAPGGYASNRRPSAGGGAPLPTAIGRLFLAGSETADVRPTYIEGALASAERAVREIRAARI